jgi:hypothetical protein
MCIQEASVGPLHGGKKNAEENTNDRYVMEAWPWEPMVSRYEEIRSNMIRADGISVSDRQGHSLILHRGLAAWIRAWITISPALPATRIPIHRGIEAGDVTARIVSIITTMVLSNPKEITNAA